MPTKKDLAKFSNVPPSDGTKSIRIVTSGSSGGSYTLKIGGQTTTHSHNNPNPFGSWLPWKGEIIEVSRDGSADFALQRNSPTGDITGNYYPQPDGKHYFYLTWLNDNPNPTYLEQLYKLRTNASHHYVPK